MKITQGRQKLRPRCGFSNARRSAKSVGTDERHHGPGGQVMANKYQVLRIAGSGLNRMKRKGAEVIGTPGFLILLKQFVDVIGCGAGTYISAVFLA